MTKEEILAMKAGAELDYVVSQKVMGQGQEGLGFRTDYNNYSTDISAAWQIVEKLILGYVFNLYFDDVGDCWVCELFGGQQEYRGYGTAPEAICKAALLAKTLEWKTASKPEPKAILSN